MTNYSKEYEIQPFLRPILWFLFYSFVCVYVFVLLVLFTGGASDPASIQSATIIMLALFPFFLPIIYLLYQNYGKTILTDNEIISVKLGHKKQVRYSEVITVKEKDFHFPKNLVIRSKSKIIRISHNSCHFGEIYDILINKIAAFQISVNVGFPWMLKVKLFEFIKWANIVGIVLVWGAPFGIVYSLLPTYETNSKLHVTVLFVLLWAILSGLTIWMYLKEEWNKTQPYFYRFAQNHIEFKIPRRKTGFVPIEKVEKIELLKVKKAGSVPGEGISVSFDAFSVVIRISGKQLLVIDDNRARQFGHTTLKIYHTLLKLYPALS